MFPQSSQAAFCSTAAQMLFRRQEINKFADPAPGSFAPPFQFFCPIKPIDVEKPEKPLQTPTLNSLFPPAPSAADQFKLLQQLQLFNLARFGMLQQQQQMNEIESVKIEKEHEEEELIELRVGSKRIMLRKSEDEGVVARAHPNGLVGDVLVYSLQLPNKQCYHAVTYNGIKCLEEEQIIEFNSEQFQLLVRVGHSNEANLKALDVFGEWKCRALKAVEPGEELLLLEGNDDHIDSSDEMPEPLTPQKPDPTAAFQFLFAANQLVTEKKRRRFKCPSFEEVDFLTNAAQNEVSETGYQCDRCGKVFTYAYYRDKHLKYTRCVDNGDRKFPCSLCSRSFEKRDRLRIHILHVHENHRPHVCNVCGKAFSQSSSLNKHLRVHSGERPYQCPFCSKSFTASSILRTHIRQHSGEKPFKCSVCGKAFASHAAHDSHVRRTHSAPVLQQMNVEHNDADPSANTNRCVECDKCFGNAAHLQFHKDTVHASSC